MSRLRRAPDVGVYWLDGVLYLAPLPHGPILILDQIATLIWNEALAGDEESLVDRVAATTGTTPDEIGASVAEFVDTLIARGVLEPREV